MFFHYQFQQPLINLCLLINVEQFLTIFWSYNQILVILLLTSQYVHIFLDLQIYHQNKNFKVDPYLSLLLSLFYQEYYQCQLFSLSIPSPLFQSVILFHQNSSLFVFLLYLHSNHPPLFLSSLFSLQTLPFTLFLDISIYS